MFITKKKHKQIIENEIYTHNQAQQKIKSSILKKCENEKRELKKDLTEVINNLIKISLARSYEDNRWRVVIELDPDMMVLALERGNDREMIEYICDEIKYKAMREIMSCNIQRPKDLNLGRPKINYI